MSTTVKNHEQAITTLTDSVKYLEARIEARVILYNKDAELYQAQLQLAEREISIFKKELAGYKAAVKVLENDQPLPDA